MPSLSEPVKFFRDHAEFNYAPARETPSQGRLRCARELARAEKWLLRHEHEVEWVDDRDADRSWLDDGDYRPLFGCVVSVRLAGEHGSGGEELTSSLWAIDLGPTGDECDDYRRVVVAELASELMHESQTSGV